MKILRPYTLASGVVAATVIAVATVPGAAHASTPTNCVSVSGTSFSFNCSIPTNPGGVTGTVSGSGSTSGGSGSYTLTTPTGTFSGLFTWPAFTLKF